MARINGPIATPTAEPPIQSQESAQRFTTTAGIGGATREPLPTGQTIPATPSLTISAHPGTRHLTLTDADFLDMSCGTLTSAPAQSLRIIKQGQQTHITE